MTQVQSARKAVDMSRPNSRKDVETEYACKLVELQSPVSKGRVGRVVKKRTSVVGCDGDWDTCWAVRVQGRSSDGRAQSSGQSRVADVSGSERCQAQVKIADAMLQW